MGRRDADRGAGCDRWRRGRCPGRGDGGQADRASADERLREQVRAARQRLSSDFGIAWVTESIDDSLSEQDTYRVVAERGDQEDRFRRYPLGRVRRLRQDRGAREAGQRHRGRRQDVRGDEALQGCALQLHVRDLQPRRPGRATPTYSADFLVALESPRRRTSTNRPPTSLLPIRRLRCRPAPTRARPRPRPALPPGPSPRAPFCCWPLQAASPSPCAGSLTRSAQPSDRSRLHHAGGCASSGKRHPFPDFCIKGLQSKSKAHILRCSPLKAVQRDRQGICKLHLPTYAAQQLVKPLSVAKAFFHASAQAAREASRARAGIRREPPGPSVRTRRKKRSVYERQQTTVKSVCMDAEEIERSLTRIAHQILEHEQGSGQHRDRGHRDSRRSSRQEARREDRGDRGREGAARKARHQLLPRRLR